VEKAIAIRWPKRIFAKWVTLAALSPLMLYEVGWNLHERFSFLVIRASPGLVKELLPSSKLNAMPSD
jgi:hypothetical protein